MLQPFLAPKLPLWVIYSGLLAGQLAVGVTVYAIITHNHPCRCYCRNFMQHYAPRLASGQCYTLQVYNCVHHRCNCVVGNWCGDDGGAQYYDWGSSRPIPSCWIPDPGIARFGRSARTVYSTVPFALLHLNGYINSTPRGIGRSMLRALGRSLPRVILTPMPRGIGRSMPRWI